MPTESAARRLEAVPERRDFPEPQARTVSKAWPFSPWPVQKDDGGGGVPRNMGSAADRPEPPDARS